jgi:hypothetical protein
MEWRLHIIKIIYIISTLPCCLQSYGRDLGINNTYHNQFPNFQFQILERTPPLLELPLPLLDAIYIIVFLSISHFALWSFTDATGMTLRKR